MDDPSIQRPVEPQLQLLRRPHRTSQQTQSHVCGLCPAPGGGHSSQLHRTGQIARSHPPAQRGRGDCRRKCSLLSGLSTKKRTGGTWIITMGPGLRRRSTYLWSFQRRPVFATGSSRSIIRCRDRVDPTRRSAVHPPARKRCPLRCDERQQQHERPGRHANPPQRPGEVASTPRG